MRVRVVNHAKSEYRGRSGVAICKDRRGKGVYVKFSNGTWEGVPLWFANYELESIPERLSHPHVLRNHPARPRCNTRFAAIRSVFGIEPPEAKESSDE